MATASPSGKSTTRSTVETSANSIVTELRGLVESQIRAVSELKPLIEASSAASLDTRVAAAEARASVAEARASVAELRTVLAQMSSELVEQREVLNTIIDALADLRNDFSDFTEHTHVEVSDDDE